MIHADDLLVEAWGRGSGVYMDGRPAPPLYGVRITHRPTGISVECDEKKSQLQNKTIALSRLRAALPPPEEPKP